MKNPFRSPFGAIFQAEVLLNSKRVAPYLMALLCAGNGLLWWGWGPATRRGLAVNSDAFIAGVLPVYSFLTLPLFTALFMADPVTRDFRAGVDPLIFSKPVSRVQYLLGKFFGNFFVLACCQSAFVLTWFVLQGVHKPDVVTQNVKVVPYIKHFFVFVVISHLVLASFYFAVGVLTRNSKIVYGLGAAFYPIYITYQTELLNRLPWRWKLALDPLAMNRGRGVHTTSAEVLNQLIVVYDTDLIVNRAMMILLAAICLVILYSRFAIAERAGTPEKFSLLNLSNAAERINYDSESLLATRADQLKTFDPLGKEALINISLPKAAIAAPGIRATVSKLISAVGTELRLLRAERSLIVLVPLAIFLSIFDLAFYKVIPDPSYSATYAVITAKTLLVFVFGMTVFFTGEAMHRDRELKIEPVLWSAPVSNNVLLLSKFLATFGLAVLLVLFAGIIAILIQFIKADTPVEILPFLITYSVILLPTIIFLTSASIVLNVLLRDKYLTYVVIVGISGGLFYLYNIGYNHWLYNPLLYRLWSYVDLTGTSNTGTILLQRLYFLAIAVTCLSFAHMFFQRKSTKELFVHGRPSGRGLSLLITLGSLTIALVSALMMQP